MDTCSGCTVSTVTPCERADVQTIFTSLDEPRARKRRGAGRKVTREPPAEEIKLPQGGICPPRAPPKRRTGKGGRPALIFARCVGAVMPRYAPIHRLSGLAA